MNLQMLFYITQNGISSGSNGDLILCSWSGIEYPNASLFFYERLPKNGLTIVSDIRARQDGTRRSPWNGTIS